jgi:hypothetical protein
MALFDTGEEVIAPAPPPANPVAGFAPQRYTGELPECITQCKFIRYVVTAGLCELAGAGSHQGQPDAGPAPSPLPQVIYLPRPWKKHSFEDKALAFLRELYLTRPRARAAELERSLRQEAARQGWKIGSRASVYRAIRSFMDESR